MPRQWAIRSFPPLCNCSSSKSSGTASYWAVFSICTGQRIRRNWGDSVFRLLRSRLLSMEVWTTVVIAVETLALIYYRAVLQATESRLLQTICRQILRDEIPHLQFQYERLAQIHAGRRPLARRLTLYVQRVLFFGTTSAVWIAHHRARRPGRFPFRRFWRTAWKRMELHWQRMGLIGDAEDRTSVAAPDLIALAAQHPCTTKRDMDHKSGLHRKNWRVNLHSEWPRSATGSSSAGVSATRWMSSAPVGRSNSRDGACCVGVSVAECADLSNEIKCRETVRREENPCLTELRRAKE